MIGRIPGYAKKTTIINGEAGMQKLLEAFQPASCVIRMLDVRRLALLSPQNAIFAGTCK